MNMKHLSNIPAMGLNIPLLSPVQIRSVYPYGEASGGRIDRPTMQAWLAALPEDAVLQHDEFGLVATWPMALEQPWVTESGVSVLAQTFYEAADQPLAQIRDEAQIVRGLTAVFHALGIDITTEKENSVELDIPSFD